MTMYAGDEFYDDDVTSGPLDDGMASCDMCGAVADHTYIGMDLCDSCFEELCVP